MANWASLFIRYYQPTAEIAVVGPEAQAFRKQLHQQYLPDAVVVGTETKSDLPLLEDRVAVNGQTTVYVCFNSACQLPVHSVKEALGQLEEARK
ncbi:MAG TPA: hypothetical protein DCR93_11500 [Cytophagales bacterium]|nr:hypothetical protein [Cytophagales bacterium]